MSASRSFALAMCDVDTERALLQRMTEQGYQVIERCLTPESANLLGAEVELVIDATFHRRFGHRLQREYHVVDLTSDFMSQPQSTVSASLPITTFLGASGGAGVTTTALYSAARAAGSVLVIDANLWQPSARLYTSTLSGSGDIAAAIRSHTQPLKDLAIHWTGNVWVLGGVDSPSRRIQLTEDLWRNLLKRAVSEFDDVRIDLGQGGEHPVIEESLRLSSQCVVVALAHPTSVIHVRSAVETSSPSAVCVLNRHSPGPIATTAERILSAAIGRDAEVVIAEDAEGYNRAFIRGEALGDRRTASTARALDLLNARIRMAAH